MTDDPPPLPDTDDPRALLGVARAADERAIKKAYARLVRIYRPDRAPVEFDRITRAFEALRANAILRIERAPRPLPDPPPAPEPPRPRERLLPRFEAALVEGRRDELAAMLRDPALRARADEDVETAVAALRALAALGWYRGDLDEVRRSYGALPRELGVGYLLDRLDHEHAYATVWRTRSIHLPEPLIAVIADAALVSAARHRAVVAAVERELLAEPARGLEVADRIAAVPALADVVVGRLHDLTPWRVRTLRDLPERRFHAIGRTLVELDARIRGPVRSWMVGAGALGGLGALRRVPAVGIALLGVSAATAAWKLASAGRRYRARVRAPLVALIAEAGVQSRVVHEWLTYNGRFARDLAGYSVAVDHDAGLRVLGAIAELVRAHGREEDDGDDR